MSSDPLRAFARFQAQLNGLDPDAFERQVDAESSFNPDAVSPRGARGIAQFMPETGKRYGLATTEDLHDPYKALPAMAKHMADLKAQAKGDEQAARVGYNAGAGRMVRYQAGGSIPKETEGYLSEIGGDDPESLYAKFRQAAGLEGGAAASAKPTATAQPQAQQPTGPRSEFETAFKRKRAQSPYEQHVTPEKVTRLKQYAKEARVSAEGLAEQAKVRGQELGVEQQQIPGSGEQGKFALQRIVESSPLSMVPPILSAGVTALSGKPIEAGHELWQALGEPQIAEYRKAQELTRARKYKDPRAALADPEIAAHFVAAFMPFLGPMAAHAGEQFAQGDIEGGAITSAALLAPIALHALRAEAIPKEVRGAEAIRGSQAKLRTEGRPGEEGQRTGGTDVYQERQGGQPVEPSEVTPPQEQVAPVPEAKPALDAQVEALTAKRGNRRAVLVTPGEEMPDVPKGYVTTKTDAGTFIHDPSDILPMDVKRRVEDGTFHELLGIKEARSPETTQVVVARDAKGNELQAALVSPDKVEAQTAEFKNQFPKATVSVEEPAKVLEERTAGRRVSEEQARAARERILKKEKPPEPVAEKPKQAEREKPIWEMSYTELDAAYATAKHADDTLLRRLFGDDAKRYARLQRKANSPYASGSEIDKASAEIEKMESRLTRLQQDELFGINQTGPTLEDYSEYRRAIGDISGSTPDELADSLKYAITKLGDPNKPIETWNPGEQVAFAQLRRGAEWAAEAGWNPREVSELAIRKAASRFHPDDIELMLGRFAKKPEERARGRAKTKALGFPEPKAEAPKKAGKEPWEMTRSEFEQARDYAADVVWSRTKMGGATMGQVKANPIASVLSSFTQSKKKSWSTDDVRREVVSRALTEGKSVPPEVLADYPDLAKQAKLSEVKAAAQKRIAEREAGKVIRVGDTIEWNQGGGRVARGRVRSISGGDYEVETGLKTTPIKTVKASAQPRLATEPTIKLEGVQPSEKPKRVVKPRRTSTPLLTEIRRAGGIDPDSAGGRDLAAYFSQTEGKTTGLIRKGGKTAEQMVQHLREQGFDLPGYKPLAAESIGEAFDRAAPNVADSLTEAMSRELKGKPYRPATDTEYLDRIDQEVELYGRSTIVDNAADRRRMMAGLDDKRWSGLLDKVLDAEKEPTAKDLASFRQRSTELGISEEGIKQILDAGTFGRSPEALDFPFGPEISKPTPSPQKLSTTQVDRVREIEQRLHDQNIPVEDFIRQRGLTVTDELNPAEADLLREMAANRKARRAPVKTEQGAMFETKPTLESRAEAQAREPQKGISGSLFAGEYGAKNKLVSQDVAKETFDRIKQRGKTERGSGGPSTEEIKDWVTLAAYHIEAGAREFGDFVQRIVDDVGERARAYAPLLYERARRYVETGDMRDLTGAKNALTEAERAFREMAPVEKQLYTTMGTAYTEGRGKVEAAPQYARRLAATVAEKPRPLTAIEVGALSYDRMRLKNDYNTKQTEIAKLIEEGRDTSAANIELDLIKREWDQNEKALTRGGREQSAAFNARKMIVREDYELLPVLNRVKAATGKAEVDPVLQKQLTELTAKYKEAESKVGTQQERINKLEAELAFKRMERDAAKARRQAKRVETRTELDEEFASLKTQFAQARKENARISPSGFAGIDPEGKLTALVGKMALNRLKAGTNTIEGIVDDIYSSLQDQLQGLTKRDVRDAISGYGRDPKRRTLDEMRRELNHMKTQMRELSKKEDIAAGVIEEPKQAARRKALLKDITDLQDRINRGEYEKPPKGKPTYDSSIAQLVRERDRLKFQIDRLIAQQKRTAGLDIATSMRQSMMLGNIVGITQDILSTTGHNIVATVQMLPSALLDAAQSTRTKQRVSTVISPIELGKAITEGIKETPREAKQIARFGLSEKQAREQEVPHEINSGSKAADAIVNVVSRTRSIVDLPNWEVGMEIAKRESSKAMALTEAKAGKITKADVGRRANEIRQNMTLADQLDLTMDAAATIAKQEAAQEARIRTFKQDNAISDFIRKGLSNRGGKEMPGPRFVFRLLLPFDKAMTDYIKAGWDLSGPGIFTGLARAMFNMARPERFGNDAVALRAAQKKANLAFSRGVTGGAGGLLLGYTLANMGVIGDPRDSENKQKGRAASLHIGNKSFDIGWVGPIAVPLAIGAGFYYNQAEGARQALGRSLTQAPLVRGGQQLYNIAQIAEAKGAEKLATFGGQLAASLIPGVAKDVAKLADTKEGQPVLRETKGFLGPIKGAIPGLRQTLPERDLGKAESADRRRKIIEGLRKNPNDTSALDKAYDTGEITAAERKQLLRDAHLTPLQLEFKGKSVEEALKAFRGYSEAQQNEVRQIMRDKIKEKALKRLPPARRERLRQQYPAEMNQ